MITEDFVSFETAKLLKEKGFNEPCVYVYCHDSSEDIWDADKEDIACQKPTLQMAMKWLREVHLLHISIDMVNGGRWEYEIDDISVPFDGGILLKYYCDKSFSSYEEAVDDAIKYSLENLI